MCRPRHRLCQRCAGHRQPVRSAAAPCSIELGTLGRRAARSSAGLVVGAGQGLETVAGRLDTLIVVGGIGCEGAAADERHLGQVHRLAGLSRRVASVCTGAHVLAAAGLLDHWHVTTPWGWGGDRLAERHPDVAVDANPFTYVTTMSTPRPESPARST
ncbi:DJ-1/PfpI family protein [Streptomyces luteogriseus]|uniref:DJ-1/PfpI family protein n=1 Tax=Streptomyces luteogriseus TaxID=68233 RepID=UPI002E3561A7|nr:DJ-1/PfpI family protein [Streptomyces luteogriseus]WTJ32919.1 DJ-1/PfpI family protein [Streptomyces luteogriseus]